jgi:hypothetical protein
VTSSIVAAAVSAHDRPPHLHEDHRREHEPGTDRSGVRQDRQLERLSRPVPEAHGDERSREARERQQHEPGATSELVGEAHADNGRCQFLTLA